MSETIKDKFKYLMGFYNEEEEDDDFVEVKKKDKEPAKPALNPYLKESPRDSNVVEYKQKPQMKLIVNEPSTFEDCSKIADNLKNRKPVIINLEKLETETAKRIFDFVSGATYALDGSVQKVANNIFVFAPDNVDISSNIEEFKTLTNANLFR